MEEAKDVLRLNGEFGKREHIIDDGTIEAGQRGDSEAFRLIFETYKDRVFSIALCFFDGNEALAQDITQDVFLKLMTTISQFEGRSQFSTWLYRLVSNACLDRKRSLRRFLSFGSSPEMEVPDRRRTAEEKYIEREIESSVR